MKRFAALILPFLDAMKTICLFLFLFTACSLRADNRMTYPEVFEQFINGWVEYDDGAYASALRSFAHAYNLDTEFYPAFEGMHASLLKMQMPEVAIALRTNDRFRRSSTFEFQPKLAYWGLFHDSGLPLEQSGVLDQEVFKLFEKSINLPVISMNPTSKDWDERGKMAPCLFNAIALAQPSEDDNSIVVTIHVMGQFNVADGSVMDVEIEGGAQWELKHAKWTLNVNPDNVAGVADTKVLQNDVRSMVAGTFEPMVMPFVIDEETASLPDIAELNDPWEILSKAAVTPVDPKSYFSVIEKFGYKDLHNFGYLPIAFGYPDWIAHQLPHEDPLRPWFLGLAQDSIRSYGKTNPERNLAIRAELIADYPNHTVGKIARLWEIGWAMNEENAKETGEEMIPLLTSLKAQMLARDPKMKLTMLDRTLATLRYFSGEADEMSVPPILKFQFAIKHTDEGDFYIVPAYLQELDLIKEAHDRLECDYKQEADILLRLGGRIMSDQRGFDAFMELWEEFPSNPQLLARSKAPYYFLNHNDGSKAERKEAHEIILGTLLALIDDGYSWKTIDSYLTQSDGSLMIHYIPEANELAAEAIERRLAKDQGLGADDARFIYFAGNCFIHFKALSPETQAVIRDYYCRDVGSSEHLRYLGWLYWNKQYQKLKAEVDYALEQQADKPLRDYQLDRYCQFYVGAKDPAAAIALLERESENTNLPEIAWVTYANALLQAGRYQEAINAADALLSELDGKFIQYRKLSYYGTFPQPIPKSAANVLLEIKQGALDKQHETELAAVE